MKRFISLLLTTMLVAMSAQAADKIYMPWSSKPGGSKQAQLQAFKNSLEKFGFEVETVNTNSCLTADAWLKDNPDKPAVTNMSVEDAIYNIVNPGTENSCEIPVTKESLIAIASTAYMNICSMEPDAEKALAKFRAGGNTVGITFTPFGVNKYLASGFLKYLDVPDSKIVTYRSGSKIIQAMVAGDVDFVHMSSAHLISKAGGTCFLSAAPLGGTKQPQMISLEKLTPNNPWIGKSHTFNFVGQNIDMERVRAAAIDAINNDPTMLMQFDMNATKVGVGAGWTPEEQWEWIQEKYTGYGNLELDM